MTIKQSRVGQNHYVNIWSEVWQLYHMATATNNDVTC
jgi:hypothetical protein